jgi:hypothetical protein
VPPEHRLLHQVLGLLNVAEHPERDAEEPRSVSLDTSIVA